jgi:hypothetical protein
VERGVITVNLFAEMSTIEGDLGFGPAGGASALAGATRFRLGWNWGVAENTFILPPARV